MLYLAVGKNELLREEFVGQLKARMLKLPMGEHNIQELGPPAAVAEVIAACSSSPFLCEKRMVIARGVLPTTSRARPGRRPRQARSRGADAAEALISYLPSLPETTHLVLVEEDGAALSDVLAAKPDAIKRDFSPLREDAVPGWVVNRARKHEARISPAAARFLAQFAGTDLRLLDSELGKLATYVPIGKTIEQADVQELACGGGPSLFSFLDAVAEKRPPAALACAHELLTLGADAGELFNQIVALVRRLLVVKELVAARRPLSQEAPSYGLSSSAFALSKLQRQAAAHSTVELLAAFRQLSGLDVAIKRGRLATDSALYFAVAGLVGLSPLDGPASWLEEDDHADPS